MPARSSRADAWTGTSHAWRSTSIAHPPRGRAHARTPPADASPPPGSGTCVPVRRQRRVSGQTFTGDPLAAIVEFGAERPYDTMAAAQGAALAARRINIGSDQAEAGAF